MNNNEIQAYIESGILESFVLGETSAEENVEIMKNLKENPELARVVQNIESALEQTALMQAIAPPAAIKQNLFERLGTENQPSEETKFSVQKSSKLNFVYKIAAAFLLLSLGLNAWLFTKYNQSKETISSLLAEKQVIAANNQKQEAAYKQLQNGMKELANPAVQSVKLSGMNARQGAAFQLYHNVQNHKVLINIDGVVPPDAGEDYQLWVLVDGKPVDLGVFNPGNEQKVLQQMKQIPLKDGQHIDAFAVTIEPRGGNKSPTLEKMVFISKT